MEEAWSRALRAGEEERRQRCHVADHRDQGNPPTLTLRQRQDVWTLGKKIKKTSLKKFH